MDFSAANEALWNPIIQLGIMAMLILGANVLRRKIAFIRNSLVPTAVLAGFILLLLRNLNIFPVDKTFLEIITYHAIALGFIALSLRIPENVEGMNHIAPSKNGALIVSTYMVQGVIGLGISLILAYTIMPDLFKASGILLPMAYGQGPGQANNVGSTYEALGMVGGRSFGLSLAAAGYLCACTVGVIYLNILNKKKKVIREKEKEGISGSVTLDIFQTHDEMPIAESVDRFSVQAALVASVYLTTYLIILAITSALSAVAPGVAGTVSTLLWGFNFIIGSMMAVVFRTVFKYLRRLKIMKHQYTNNYLMSRISGVAFDYMIVAGIASINIDDLAGLWIPFILMAVLGCLGTFFYLKFMCKRMYLGYEYEALISMFGMLTGTISSGVLLLREIDPDLTTPASDNLVTGSSFGIIFGAPILLCVSFAAKGTASVFITFGALALYFVILYAYIRKGLSR